jgi:hypothetical protein
MEAGHDLVGYRRAGGEAGAFVRLPASAVTAASASAGVQADGKDVIAAPPATAAAACRNTGVASDLARDHSLEPDQSLPSRAMPGQAPEYTPDNRGNQP